MPPIDRSLVDILTGLTKFLYTKIEANEKFANARVEEWLEKRPKYPSSCLKSSDKSQLEIISSVHGELCDLDEKNCVRSAFWPAHLVKSFGKKCEELKALIEQPGVHPSIMNVYYVHIASLERSQSRFDEAIKALDASSECLAKAIAENSVYLPRYNRELILNEGFKSEIYRLGERIPEAIASAENMLSLLEDHRELPAFIAGDLAALCPVESWALYYMCEAHVSVENWQDQENQKDRQWAFKEAFASRHYKKWIVPCLLRILSNQLWIDRYPAYHEEIVNAVYKGTARNSRSAMLRTISVFFGRIQVEPTAPALLACLAACVALHVGTPQEDHKVSLQKAAPELIDLYLAANPEIRIAPEKMARIVDAIGQMEQHNGAQLIQQMEQHSGTGLNHAVAGGSDRGTGVGFSEDASHLVLASATGIDRIIGVG